MPTKAQLLVENIGLREQVKELRAALTCSYDEQITTSYRGNLVVIRYLPTVHAYYMSQLHAYQRQMDRIMGAAEAAEDYEPRFKTKPTPHFDIVKDKGKVLGLHRDGTIENGHVAGERGERL